jgi:hypothetical protein
MLLFLALCFRPVEGSEFVPGRYFETVQFPKNSFNIITLLIFQLAATFILTNTITWPPQHNNNNNHGSTALYGLGPPLSEFTESCAFVAVGDWPTGRATVLSILMCPPEPSGRQSGDLGEKWRQFCLRNISIHARKVLLRAVNLRHGTDGFTSPPKEVVLRIFITLKSPSISVGIEPANLGSSGEHANHSSTYNKHYICNICTCH